MINITEENAEKLTEEIFNICARFDERETQLSISYLREMLAEKGWKRLGNSGEFHNGVERLGFRVLPMPNTKAIRFYVAV